MFHAALPRVQITVVRSMGIPYSKHRGVAEDAVGVRVDSTAPIGVSGLPFMAVKCATRYLSRHPGLKLNWHCHA